MAEIHSDLNIPVPEPVLLTDNGTDEVGDGWSHEGVRVGIIT